MFRARHAAANRALLWTTVGLLVAIMIATGVTVWLVVEIRKEQRAVEAILRGGWTDDIRLLGTLPGELRWQFVLTILVLVVLISAAGVIVFVVRAYLKSQSSLRTIKILAWNILASMEHGVFTTDCDGVVTSVNPRGQDLLGVDLGCVGRHLTDVFAASASLVAVSQEVVRSGEPQYDHDFTVARSGHSMRLRAECHVLRGGNDEMLGTVLHIRDVTERVLMDERIRRMERFMGLGALAAGLHHEIKNPLSALSLHVQLLEERLEGKADDDVSENLGVLETEVTRIAGVLESFRDYASIERLSPTATDVAAIVRQTVDLIRPSAQQQHVRIETKFPDTAMPNVSADSARIEQVLLNLVINALDEMRDGGTLSLVVGREDGRIFVKVGDTGRGIADNVRLRIFDPYFTTKSKGSGMGLAFCEKIIRQHGGRIDFETGPSGTAFHISLPLDENEWTSKA